MAKIVLIFLMVFVFFFIGILAFKEMTGKERWALTQVIAYSIMCAVLATLVLTIFVLLF